MLTGKAKEDFWNWFHSSDLFVRSFNQYDFYALSGREIEFFETMGIVLTIFVEQTGDKEWKWGACIYLDFFSSFEETELFDDRKSAITNGIQKANEIYNSK